MYNHRIQELYCMELKRTMTFSSCYKHDGSRALVVLIIKIIYTVCTISRMVEEIKNILYLLHTMKIYMYIIKYVGKEHSDSFLKSLTMTSDENGYDNGNIRISIHTNLKLNVRKYTLNHSFIFIYQLKHQESKI